MKVVGWFSVLCLASCGVPEAASPPVPSPAAPAPAANPGALADLPGAQPAALPLNPMTWQQQLARTTVSLQINGASFCSGTWLTRHTVLTAAHCVEELAPGSFVVSTADRPNAPGATLPTRAYVLHPSYVAARARANKTDITAAYAADFAVVEVPQGMPLGERVALLDFASIVKPLSVQNIAGYGHTGLVGGVARDSGVLRHGPFTAVYKFDNATRQAGGSGTYWLLDGGMNEVCTGDSGGPAFWTSGTTVMQFGVNSYISGATPAQIAELQEIDRAMASGKLLPLGTLDRARDIVQHATMVQERACSRYIQVASVGDHRDWIEGQGRAVEARYGG